MSNPRPAAGRVVAMLAMTPDQHHGSHALGRMALLDHLLRHLEALEVLVAKPAAERFLHPEHAQHGAAGLEALDPSDRGRQRRVGKAVRTLERRTVHRRPIALSVALAQLGPELAPLPTLEAWRAQVEVAL